MQLRGFDVDLSQICAKEWLPPNVSMHQWDMFEDIPAEHKGKYGMTPEPSRISTSCQFHADMVNIRFVVPVVHQDPTPILLRLMSMLKPGGWLQWMEQDPYTFKPRTALPNTSIPATQKLHDLLHGQLLEQVGPCVSSHNFVPICAHANLSAPGWIGNLPNLFNAVNLVKVDKYDVKMPDWALSHFQDTVLMALDEMAPHFSTLDLKTATADGAREMFALKRGVASSGDCVIVIGQKPLDP